MASFFLNFHFGKNGGFFTLYFTLFSFFSIFSACADSKTSTADEAVLGITVPEFNTSEDVQEYVKAVIQANAVEGYQLPDGIIAEDYSTSSENLNALYPEFSGKGGNALLSAVEVHPLRYQEMIRDLMALRTHFDPEWQNKRNQQTN